MEYEVLIAQADTESSEGHQAYTEEQSSDPFSILKEGLLKTEPGLLIWTAVTFLLLVLVLWKFAWKPITTGLDSRADRIKKDLDEAEQKSKKAQELIDEKIQELDKARKEASDIINRAEKTAKESRQDILDKAKKEADDQVVNAKRQIDEARDRALDEIKQSITNLSIEIAQKMIQKSLSPEDHKSLIEDTINRKLTN